MTDDKIARPNLSSVICYPGELQASPGLRPRQIGYMIVTYGAAIPRGHPQFRNCRARLVRKNDSYGSNAAL